MNNKPLGSDDFLRLGRYVQHDYLEGKLSFEEMIVLVWLQLSANPHNGRCKANYEGLARDLNGLVRGLKKGYRKNFMNKVMLALKEKKYLSYPCQQGRRSSFGVLLNNYPLSDKTFTSIEHLAEKEHSRSQKREIATTSAENISEVPSHKQKLNDDKRAIEKPFLSPSSFIKSRSPNNNNEKENVISDTSNKGTDNDTPRVRDFIPNSYEETRCQEIAIWLGEKDMKFILSRLRKHGLDVIEKAWALTKEDWESGFVKNKGGYFNTKIKKLTGEGDPPTP